MELVETLLDNDQYKKLAEYVLMRKSERDDTFVFEEIGALREIIEKRLQEQMNLEIKDILSDVKQY